MIRDISSRRNFNVLVTGMLAIVCGLVAGLVDAPAPRIAAGAVLALLLPGYALTMLVFARRDLDWAELALGTLAGSLVVSALGGLLLDGLPGHMGRLEWAGLLALVTVAASAASAARPAEPFAARQPDPAGPSSAVPPVRARGTLVLNVALAFVAAALVTGAVLVARHAANRSPAFSELSSLPASRGATPRFSIRLASHEHTPTTFTIVAVQDGRPTGTWRVRLNPGGRTRILTPPIRARARRLRVTVYRGLSPQVYLHTLYFLHAARATVARRATGTSRFSLLSPSLTPTGPAPSISPR